MSTSNEIALYSYLGKNIIEDSKMDGGKSVACGLARFFPTMLE